MRSLLMALAFVVVAAPGAARDMSRIPEATPDGKPVSCIPLSAIRNSHVRSDEIIDFEMSNGKTYRSTLPYGCPSLGFEQRFTYETSLSELCSTDIITVLYSSPLQRGASCGLGEFQPVTLTPTAHH